MSGSNINTLKVTDAAENNLQNVCVDIPHNSLTVITGVSGSGKTSLAYDVIYRESQRRFLESFSSFSRQYMGKLEKPLVKSITGLQPALALNQKSVVSNPRSTAGTLSGVYDYLRLLYARTGIRSCIRCSARLPGFSDGKCSACGHEHPALSAGLFSFNSPAGSCPSCKGLGVEERIDPQRLISDENKSLREGALVPTTPTGYIVYSQVRVDELEKVCRAHGFSVDTKWKDLTLEQQDVIWYGSDRVRILFGKHPLESRLKWKGITAKPREEAFYKGMIPIMEEILHRDRNDNILRFTSSYSCTSCRGKRLKPEALQVSVQDKSIADLSGWSLQDLYEFLSSLTSESGLKAAETQILSEAIRRLEYLRLLGLGYLTLSRNSTTLSGGESQRIRLASQVGSGLQGILYILDEPSIGLHPRDNKRLLEVLKALRDNGNTVLVVEHEEEFIRAADYLIDMGPKAGEHGGKILFQGRPFDLLSQPELYPDSQTAFHLGPGRIPEHTSNALPTDKSIRVRGARKHNLKNLNIDFRMQSINLVTGVSGAGKSTLVHDVLALGLADGKTRNQAEMVADIPVARVIEIDQAPIGRTPRSNPATYTGLFDRIRDLFGNQLESKSRGYKKGRFSFNNKGGRCESCQGAGSIQLGMHFLGNVEIGCTECGGKRFNKETLEIEYRGKNIYEVLELSVEEALVFFGDQEKISRILDQLIQLDLGYLKLGQPSTTLSGGEAQRIKLASELHKTSPGHNLYVLDEPTTGLHIADIHYLQEALNKLVAAKHTVVVIEHDPRMILQAHHVIDLGPEGGTGGGEVVFQGSAAELLKHKESLTAAALNDWISKPRTTQTGPLSERPGSDIQFEGLTTNNLKNISVRIPLNKITAITGVSGSGKSSLAFDSIYAESRNRFTESLSSYARRMMSKVRRADLEHCSGLTPAIAIRQDRFGRNPRSTVGTVTEIYDLYRILYSRAGRDPSGRYSMLPASCFSFNNQEAACPVCSGMGVEITTTEERLITSPEKPLTAGALDGSVPGRYFGDPSGRFVHTLLEVGRVKGMDFNLPFNVLDRKAKNIALFGTGREEYEVDWKFKRGKRSGVHHLNTTWKGFIAYVNEEFRIKEGGKRGEAYKEIMAEQSCPECHGARLRENVLDIRVDGKHIAECSEASIHKSIQFFKQMVFGSGARSRDREKGVAEQILKKLVVLEQIGLGYLSVNRNTSSLSGGEAQRLRIATQLVSDLCGLTYVLDEPTIGLHDRDTRKLMDAIKTIHARGNTMVLVEHDPVVIRQAHNIIEMGPRAGRYGGTIVAEGNLAAILNNPASVTRDFLKKVKTTRLQNHSIQKAGIRICGATANNLCGIDLDIPTGALVSITGVSGSGKTSLVFDVIARSYRADRAIHCKKIEFKNVADLRVMDQHKIGTSPLSTTATYSGLFDLIRKEFATLPQAKSQQLKKSHFSFNSRDGQCPACKGMGKLKMSLDFLSDVWTSCDHCQGKRFRPEILEVKLHSKSIHDVLEMEISEARSFFKGNSRIQRTLDVLERIGLGYLKLGQPTSSLSGGETQRLKLASYLTNVKTGSTVFVFDEPSTGLHGQDVQLLLAVFDELLSNGHSLLVVEHNPQIIAASHWVVELGPEGGESGGQLIRSEAVSEVYFQ